MGYAWEGQPKKAFPNKMGEWLKRYVESHTKEEMLNIDISVLARELYEFMDNIDRKYQYEHPEWPLYCTTMDKAKEIAGGEEELLKQFENFVLDKIYKNLERYKAVTVDECRQIRPEFVEHAMVYNTITGMMEPMYPVG